MQENHPELLTYINMNGGAPESFYQALIDTGIDALTFDRYPFLADGTTNTSVWFYRMMQVRNICLQNDIPYWGWMQAYTYEPNPTVRVLSESDLRFNAYTMLTAGYTGLVYFHYDVDSDNPQISQTGVFLDANGDPTPFYHNAATMNREIARIGESLKYLTSTEVRFVSGGIGVTPTGLTYWLAEAGGESRITSIAVSDPTPSTDGDGLIGLFTDDDGDRYFMLTNLDHAANTSAAATSLSLVVTFLNENAIYRLNRTTGAPERIDLVNHVLNLTLPGGTGELFKFGDGYFAGILPGDSDLDGDVDLSDLATLAGSYGIGAGRTWLTGDFDLDGDVDLSDLSVLAAHYGSGTAQAFADFQMLQSVPEPAAAFAIAMNGALLHLRPRRWRKNHCHFSLSGV